MYYFIVNPTSSSGKGLQTWNRIEELLRSKRVPFEAYILDHPGEAAEIARELSISAAPCTIVVLGGDGTINEFISGLTTFSGITFAYVPTGSGNDFARGMHIDSDAIDVVTSILESSRRIDINIGQTTDPDTGESRRFAISSGFGFDAAACHDANLSSLKKSLNVIHLGKLVYLFSALKMLAKMKPFSMKLLTDDGSLVTYQKVIFAAAMNTKYEGGGFKFAPKASPSDNMIDLLIVDGIPKWKVLLILPTAFWGGHLRFQGIQLIRCSKAAIQTDVAQCVHTDGEHFDAHKKITFSLLPEKLKMILP